MLNDKKTKYTIVNFCKSKQFKTRLFINNSLIEQVSQTRLLGVILSEDLTWHANTQDLVKRAHKRMIMLRKLKEFRVKQKDMLLVYKLYIRSVIEQSSVVWSSSLTQEEELALERTQKVALRLIYQSDYESYENALLLADIPTVTERFRMLAVRFATKCTKSENTAHMFPLAPKPAKDMRMIENFHVPMARKERFFKSAIPTMARALNEENKIP